MQERTWQEYDTPGTPVLTAEDVELAEKRLEPMWQDALLRARVLRVEREERDRRSSQDIRMPHVAATVAACGWLPASAAQR